MSQIKSYVDYFSNFIYFIKRISNDYISSFFTKAKAKTKKVAVTLDNANNNVPFIKVTNYKTKKFMQSYKKFYTKVISEFKSSKLFNAIVYENQK